VPKVKVVWDTFLKKQAIGSQDLANSEKIFVPKDHEFYVNKYAPIAINTSVWSSVPPLLL
jgi:hypothetical protein